MDANALNDRPAPPQDVIPPHTVTCRRRNRVHDAIVEAALTIERKLGLDHAMALLRHESVPASVAARIMAQGPRQLRARRHPAVRPAA